CAGGSLVRADRIAASMRAVHDRARAGSPTLGAAGALVAGYLAAIALGLVVVIPMWSLAHASNDFDREAKLDDLTLRHPHSFEVSHEGRGLQLTRGSEAVLVLRDEVTPDQTAEKALGGEGLSLMMTLPPEPGHPAESRMGSCAGLTAPQTH